MKGIKECLVYMISNPNKKIKCKSVMYSEMYFDGEAICYDCEGNKASNVNFKIFEHEWEPVKEPVDFMTAINSGKKMYPVEYCSQSDETELEEEYKDNEESITSIVLGWLTSFVLGENELDYINGMWYLED